MSFLTQLILQKAVDKAIAKAVGHAQAKAVASQTDTYYNGIYMFGMDTYATFKVASIFLYIIAIFITLSGFIVGIVASITGILFGLFTYAMLKIASRRFGFILYTDNYIKIIKQEGKDTTTLSISGLKSLEYKYPNYIFVGQEDTAQVVSGGGEGFADFIDHLNARRPELVQVFFQNQNVSNAYYCDRNNIKM